MLRLFNDLMGGQASWLLPAALLVVVAGLAWRLRAPRTDRTRAAIMLWGGWLVVSGLVFSLSAGVIHTYYTVALAPAIAALVAIGAALAWRSRERVRRPGAARARRDRDRRLGDRAARPDPVVGAVARAGDRGRGRRGGGRPADAGARWCGG